MVVAGDDVDVSAVDRELSMSEPDTSLAVTGTDQPGTDAWSQAICSGVNGVGHSSKTTDTTVQNRTTETKRQKQLVFYCRCCRSACGETAQLLSTHALQVPPPRVSAHAHACPWAPAVNYV